jgi:two-component system copper resistance phosphate regulon response regulator CusR
MRILIVEDEKKTARYLRRGFTEKGFDVEVASDGAQGLREAQTGRYDLVLLDIMLPERDGWSVLEELRTSDKETPVLCLTARDAVIDRVRGLELGADDYLVKPFAFSELLARVHTLLRRGPSRPLETLRVANLELDLLGMKARRAGRLLDLTPKEFALLSLLARHKGEVFSRELIARQIWGMRLGGDTNVIDVHVRRLRAKVDDPFEGRLVQTVRGVGYVLDEPK